MNNLHSLFQAILKPYTAPIPSPESIDRAMLADKLNDGYFQRKIQNAIKLEQQNAKYENPFY